MSTTDCKPLQRPDNQSNSDPDSRPPPVSFSPPKAPPISAPLGPVFTLAMPQSLPLTDRNLSDSRLSGQTGGKVADVYHLLHFAERFGVDLPGLHRHQGRNRGLVMSK